MNGTARGLLAPGVGWAFGCSRTGAAHLRAGRPCQDAFLLQSGSAVGLPYLAAAVADGHGNVAHDLSQFGAALAVQAAAEEWQALLTFRASDPTALLTDFQAHFAVRLSRRWRQRVAEDARRRDLRGPRLLRRYGTTLLTALALPDWLLLARIGDGEILLLGADGVAERPLDGGPPSANGETFSLAGNDVPFFMCTAVRARPDGVLLLATDGLTNRFGPGGLEFFAETVAERVRSAGVAAVAQPQPAWLDHFSVVGNGDDVTLLVIGLEDSAPDSV